MVWSWLIRAVALWLLHPSTVSWKNPTEHQTYLMVVLSIIKSVSATATHHDHQHLLMADGWCSKTVVHLKHGWRKTQNLIYLICLSLGWFLLNAFKSSKKCLNNSKHHEFHPTSVQSISMPMVCCVLIDLWHLPFNAQALMGGTGEVWLVLGFLAFQWNWASGNSKLTSQYELLNYVRHIAASISRGAISTKTSLLLITFTWLVSCLKSNGRRK